MNINKLVEKLEVSLNELYSIFLEKDNNFFFTEKEIHSYFYHLCLNNFIHNKYNLIHTEYPTPFKCKNIKEEPYIEKADKNSKVSRAHIDLVLINPNFIDYSLNIPQKNPENIIMGLGHKLFSEYIDTFYEIYKDFGNEYNESIILYSLEFKYLRHNNIGEKNPVKEIKRDIRKLKLLEEYKINDKIPFSKNNKSIVFIGNRINEKIKASINKIENDNCIVKYHK